MKHPENIFGIVQVRLRSTRLKNKALLDIEGITAIERVVHNARGSKYIKDVIVATTDCPEDDQIVDLLKEKNILCFRGDEIDVIGRHYYAAKKFGADVIVRTTGDCPLVSPELIDYSLERHFEAQADFTGMALNEAPIGSFSDVFNLAALERMRTYDVDFNYGEYLTVYFRNNPDIFKVNIISPPEELRRPEFRLTMDYAEDLELFRRIFKELGKGQKAILLKDVIALLDKDQSIGKLNKDLKTRWKDDKNFSQELFEKTRIKC